MPNSPKIPKRNRHTNGCDDPSNPKDHHRLEAITYVFLSVWITADILVVYGHTGVALWAFYFALTLPIYLLAHHTGAGWPTWKAFCKWVFVVILIILPLVLYIISRLAGFSIYKEMDVTFDGFGHRNSGGFWCVHRGGSENQFQTVNSPVYMALYVKFINERDSPIFITGFSVETRTTNGDWELMPVFDVHPDIGTADFYFVQNTNGINPDFKHPITLDFKGDLLQSQFVKQSINPHEPVQGWLMMDSSKSDCRTYKFRMSIETGGEKITRDFKVESGDKNNMDIQIVKLGFRHNFGMDNAEKDISDIPRVFYKTGANVPP